VEGIQCRNRVGSSCNSHRNCTSLRRENLIFKLMIPVIVVVWRDSVATKKICRTEAKPDICVVHLLPTYVANSWQDILTYQSKIWPCHWKRVKYFNIYIKCGVFFCHPRGFQRGNSSMIEHLHEKLWSKIQNWSHDTDCGLIRHSIILMLVCNLELTNHFS
jgi:hypothetical protein